MGIARFLLKKKTFFTNYYLMTRVISMQGYTYTHTHTLGVLQNYCLNTK